VSCIELQPVGAVGYIAAEVGVSTGNARRARLGCVAVKDQVLEKDEPCVDSTRAIETVQRVSRLFIDVNETDVRVAE